MSQQKIAIVTGANRGLGRSEGLAMAADSVDVVVTYRSHEDEAATVVAEIEALGQRGVALTAHQGLARSVVYRWYTDQSSRRSTRPRTATATAATSPPTSGIPTPVTVLARALPRSSPASKRSAQSFGSCGPNTR